MVSSSTSVHYIAPPLVFFRLAYLASAALAAISSNHVFIFNLNVSIGDKVPNTVRVAFLFFYLMEKKIDFICLKIRRSFPGVRALFICSIPFHWHPRNVDMFL